MPVWSPLICKCIFRIASDGQDTPALQEVLGKCPDHATLSDTDCYATVCEECRRVNYSLAEALEVEGISPTQQDKLVQLQGEAQEIGIPLPFLLSPIQQQSLAKMQHISNGYRWSFGPGRVLTVSFPGVNKLSLQVRLNTRFGPGRVRLA